MGDGTEIIYQAASLLLVALIWGITNPLMKRGSQGITKVADPSQNFIIGLLSEFLFLFTRLQWVIPFLINIAGSVLFYFTLGSAPLSLVVPLTNSLTFIVTSISAYLIGESSINKDMVMGMAFILAGVSICISAQSANRL